MTRHHRFDISVQTPVFFRTTRTGCAPPDRVPDAKMSMHRTRERQRMRPTSRDNADN